jgi:molecular chaperone DnaK
MILGIDLGTTKSVIGVWDNQKQSPFIIPDIDGHNSIPSLLLVTPDDRIFAGRMAKKHPDRYNGNNIMISSVKRLMGKASKTQWGDWNTYPQEVSAFILSELKHYAEKYLGQKIKDVIIAIPSHFDEKQRRATKEAAEIAGLNVIRLLNEATAAALTYGFIKQPYDEKILIFDLGGGTLDVSIIALGEGIFCEVKCIEGDTNLGGDDFDQVIIDYILKQVFHQFGVTINLDEMAPIRKWMLKEKAEEAKINLSSSENTRIFIPGFLNIDNKHYDIDVSLDRDTFEKLSQSIADRALNLLRKALSSAHINPSELSNLLLIGGSSRIPLIKELIEKELNIKPFTGINFETVVAQGAILQGAIKIGDLKDALLLDVVPNSYGIEVSDGTFSRMIEKDTTIPTKRSQIFTTSTDNQTEISIPIYQGEKEKASDNVFLGVIQLSNIPRSPKGIPQIEVNFDIDANMMIAVTAQDMKTGKKQTVMVNSPHALSNMEIIEMNQNIEFWLSERNLLELKPQIDSYISDIEKTISNNATALDQKTIIDLRECIKRFNSLVDKKTSSEKFEEMFSSTRPIYDSAQKQINKYQNIIVDINKLIAKILDFVPKINPFDEKEADLLSHGSNILNDYLQRNLPYKELEKIFIAVRSSYEEVKVKLFKRYLEELISSEQMVRLIGEVKAILANPFSTDYDLSIIRDIDENRLIINLLESEEMEYNRSIIKRFLEGYKEDYSLCAYFIFIASAFYDFNIISVIRKLPQNINTEILAFALFNGLDDNKCVVTQKRIAAQIFRENLPDVQYIPIAVFLVINNSDTIVRKLLLDYLKRQPPGAIYEFLANIDPYDKPEICIDKDILSLLSKEPDKKCFFKILELSLNFHPHEKIIPIFLSYANNEDSEIRIKALELIDKIPTETFLSFINEMIKCKNLDVSGNITNNKTILFKIVASDENNINDKAIFLFALRSLFKFSSEEGVTEIFIQTLKNHSVEKQLLALEYIKENKVTESIPHLIELLQLKQNAKNIIVREKIIDILANLEDAQVIPHLLKLTVEDNHNISTLAVTALEKNIELMETSVKKLFDIIKKLIEKERHLNFIEALYLRKFSNKHPDMIDFIETLKRKYGK